MRSFLTMLGIAIGIAAVVLLTAVGEGARRYVVGEFTQFGSRLMAVTPGRTQTLGVSGAVFATTRPLTLADSEALALLPETALVVPVVQGNVEVEAGRRQRRTEALGVGPDALRAWNLRLAMGRFLPREAAASPRALAVLGAHLKRELFGSGNPLGRVIRIAGHRFRVIGVMAPRGRILGFDIDRAIYVPAARTLEIFDREHLMEVDVVHAEHVSGEVAVRAVRRLLVARHGREDFTITTQAQMLDVLGGVLNTLTALVGVLGAISLLVGGIGILTLLTIAVGERSAEIGLLRALGCGRGLVSWLFLLEAAVLAVAGGLMGLSLAALGAGLAAIVLPALPVHVSAFYSTLALLLALLIGLLAGVAPARRAASVEPVAALRAE